MIYINSLRRILTFAFLLFLFGAFSLGTAHANDEVGSSKITITNDQTGEVTVMDEEEIKKNVKVKSIKNNGQSKKIDYDVFVPIEDPSAISIFDSSGGSKTGGGVTARLSVDYDLRSTTIRVNSVSGSWTPSSNMYGVSSRTVNMHSGPVYGRDLATKYPTSNSFKYTTGWGYNSFATGQASPRAWTSAKVRISGMTATYTLNLDVTFP